MLRTALPLAIAVVVATPSVALASFPGRDGRVAFTSARSSVDGDELLSFGRGIATVRPNGAGDRSLIQCVQVPGRPDRGDCSIHYRTPAWSANGRLLAFDAGARLGLVRVNGSAFTLLAQQTSDDGEPAFSPTGRKLVFTGVAPPPTG